MIRITFNFIYKANSVTELFDLYSNDNKIRMVVKSQTDLATYLPLDLLEVSFTSVLFNRNISAPLKRFTDLFDMIGIDDVLRWMPDELLG